MIICQEINFKKLTIQFALALFAIVENHMRPFFGLADLQGLWGRHNPDDIECWVGHSSSLRIRDMSSAFLHGQGENGRGSSC